MNPVRFYKCLSDDTRLRCLLLLRRRGELCVCDLVTALDLSQPKVSRHLAQLRECGLLLARREGQWMHYRLHPDLPDWALAIIDTTLRGEPGFCSANIDRLETGGVCC